MAASAPLQSAAARGWPLAVALFACVYFAQYWGYLQIPDKVLIEHIYHDAIVAPGAELIRWISPGEAVRAVGNQLISGSTVLEIVRGCDGAGVGFLLVAAIFAFRGPALRMAWGIVGALAFVYAINLVRIVVLYFGVVGKHDWFLPLHAYVFPSLFVLLALIYFALWIAPVSVGHDGSSEDS